MRYRSAFSSRSTFPTAYDGQQHVLDDSRLERPGQVQRLLDRDGGHHTHASFLLCATEQVECVGIFVDHQHGLFFAKLRYHDRRNFSAAASDSSAALLTSCGSRIMKVEPSPMALSTVISPPIIWQKRRLIGRPSPVPP